MTDEWKPLPIPMRPANDERAVTHVGDRLSVRPSTVSKMMDRLIEKGLVERTVDEHDARKTIAQITPLGLKARDQLTRMRSRFDAELEKAFSSDRHGAVCTALSECQALLAHRLSRFR